MKPPPRKRSKPRSLSPVPEPPRPARVKRASDLNRAEQRRLLKGLKRLGRTGGWNQDIDYASLRKSVPTRSIPEVDNCPSSLAQTNSVLHTNDRSGTRRWTHWVLWSLRDDGTPVQYWRKTNHPVHPVSCLTITSKQTKF